MREIGSLKLVCLQRRDLRYISTILTTQITCEEESANDREGQLVCYSNRFLHYKIERFFGIRDLPQASASLLNVSTFCRIMGLTFLYGVTTRIPVSPNPPFQPYSLTAL